MNLRQILLPVVIMFCTALSSFEAKAQNKHSIEEITQLLQDAQTFIKYRTFRDDFQKLNIELGTNLQSYED